ncbi:protein arginine N-methyltransferase 5, putative [Plasmodium chabaudi adami]|uniref:Protein arginine N-methyltransferase n=1 Tax=Plasmodium chabaudi adami TaxID=5826 RepID=A0A1C6YHG4_PLACE|nr:protein arginine N-methyltransferase 5, putative [Plasmodium chabaudi adami]
MPIKNKYGILNIGIEYNYNDVNDIQISEISPDFIVTNLFKDSPINSNNFSNISHNNPNEENNKNSEYQVCPLFGDKFEDIDIWKENIYGKISEWIDTDNTDEAFSEYSIDALNKQIQWSSYISVKNLIINTPLYNKCDNYARCINSNIHNYNGVSITLKVPIAQKIKNIEHLNTNFNNNTSKHGDSSNDACENIINGWNIWAKFISYCNFDFSNLNVAIEFVNIKDININNINLDIWKSEPVKLIIIPLDVFFIDSKTGYPYLPKKLKDLLIFFFRKNVDVVLTSHKKGEHQCRYNPENGGIYLEGKRIEADEINMVEKTNNKHKLGKDVKGDSEDQNELVDNIYYLKCCVYYLKRLFMSIENFDTHTLFDSSYWDYLQIPLQPLKDNLSSQVYEIFERDKTKYEKYELAISKYLCDELNKKKYNNNPNLSNEENNNNSDKSKISKSGERHFIIFVVGAGRGPLVDCALRALETNKINKYSIYAIEKNDSAILILKNRLLNEKWKNVKVINSDMRYLNLDIKADLIVSELLGSFGDNELFPECLDSMKKYLKEDGISIPQNCLSYVEPISCAKVYYKLCNNTFSGNNENFYVINLYSYYKISEGPKECFYFDIPSKNIKNDNTHNTRYKNLNFKVTNDSYLHGFLCYFNSKLYNDVYLSIEPNTHTNNLHSWYPLFIPINKIIFLKNQQNLSFSIWRLTDNHKIWYEWCVNEPTSTIIHNYNARHFSIGK